MQSKRSFQVKPEFPDYARFVYRPRLARSSAQREDTELVKYFSHSL